MPTVAMQQVAALMRSEVRHISVLNTLILKIPDPVVRDCLCFYQLVVLFVDGVMILLQLFFIA